MFNHDTSCSIFYSNIICKYLNTSTCALLGFIGFDQTFEKNSPKRRLRNGAAIKGRICLGYFIIHVKISPTSRSGKISPLQYTRMFETCQNE